jgi:hypothetical protein
LNLPSAGKLFITVQRMGYSRFEDFINPDKYGELKKPLRDTHRGAYEKNLLSGHR